MLSDTSRLFSQLSSEDRAHSSMTLAPINFERRLLARFGSSKNDANGGKAKLLRITKLQIKKQNLLCGTHISGPMSSISRSFSKAASISAKVSKSPDSNARCLAK